MDSLFPKSESSNSTTLQAPVQQLGRPWLEQIERLKTAERRALFLAEASTLLDSTLDYRTTLSMIARLAVPSLADYCLVDMADDAGNVKSLQVAHRDPEKEELLLKLRERYPVNARIIHCIKTGESELLSSTPEAWMQAVAYDEGYFASLRVLNPRSYLIVPLVARGRTLGALSFITAESGRTYGQEDLSFARDLARRAALAIDNALLYTRVQDAIRVRDEFLTIASHELRTPLASLKLQIQFLGRNLNVESKRRLSPEDVARLLETANRQVNRVTKLVDDLLEISQLNSGTMTIAHETFDLSELVQEVVANHTEALQAAGCLLQLNIQSAAFGSWDRVRITQAIDHLLANAIKYGEGKPISITVFGGFNGAKLVIRDEGPGIAKQDQSRIFEQFERAAVSENCYGGLGLGLYLVRKILNAHGGSVQVDSAPGKGARFTVHLPISSAALRAAESPAKVTDS